MKVAYKGDSIFYTDQGEGPVIVFLHGFLESSTMWNSLIETLKTDYRCISIDLLGHGKTGSIATEHPMEMMADAVNDVLLHLHIKKATFIGHSMGGYVLLALAELYPQKFLRLCLLNSTALADAPDKKVNRSRAAKAVNQNKSVFIGMSINNLFLPTSEKLFKSEIEKLKSEALNMAEEGITAALYGMKVRPDRTGILKNLNCPKLVILGMEDTILPISLQQQYLKNTETELILLNGGHMLHIENKYEISYIILHFIENK